MRSSDTSGAGGQPPPAPALLPPGVTDPAGLATELERAGYLADDGLATAAYLTLALRRPLLLEGDAGVGKTAVAHALADVLGAPLIRLQCYEGLDASQALYDWNFPAQVLHLRAAEAAGRGEGDAAALEDELYDRRFLVARPILQALETSPSVLLIDEVDRADDEFEALLLEVLSDVTITVPELGTIRATQPPVVVLTSNRTREVHDALKRRCYYHWVEHPSFEREVAIVRLRLPDVGERLAREVTSAVHVLRDQDLLKPPGVAETLDWTQALVALGADHLDADRAAATLGSVLKFREDQERVRSIDVGQLVIRAAAGG
ncbi:MAG: MoxR family ATPase [Nitriliruptor sp.]